MVAASFDTGRGGKGGGTLNLTSRGRKPGAGQRPYRTKGTMPSDASTRGLAVHIRALDEDEIFFRLAGV